MDDDLDYDDQPAADTGSCEGVDSKNIATSRSLNDLLRAATEGDRRVFDSLFDRAFDTVYRVAAKLTGNRQAAERLTEGMLVGAAASLIAGPQDGPTRSAEGGAGQPEPYVRATPARSGGDSSQRT